MYVYLDYNGYMASNTTPKPLLYSALAFSIILFLFQFTPLATVLFGEKENERSIDTSLTCTSGDTLEFNAWHSQNNITFDQYSAKFGLNSENIVIFTALKGRKNDYGYGPAISEMPEEKLFTFSGFVDGRDSTTSDALLNIYVHPEQYTYDEFVLLGNCITENLEKVNHLLEKSHTIYKTYKDAPSAYWEPRINSLVYSEGMFTDQGGHVKDYFAVPNEQGHHKLTLTFDERGNVFRGSRHRDAHGNYYLGNVVYGIESLELMDDCIQALQIDSTAPELTQAHCRASDLKTPPAYAYYLEMQEAARKELGLSGAPAEDLQEMQSNRINPRISTLEFTDSETGIRFRYPEQNTVSVSSVQSVDVTQAPESDNPCVISDDPNVRNQTTCKSYSFNLGANSTGSIHGMNYQMADKGCHVWCTSFEEEKAHAALEHTPDCVLLSPEELPSIATNKKGCYEYVNRHGVPFLYTYSVFEERGFYVADTGTTELGDFIVPIDHVTTLETAHIIMSTITVR